MTEQTSPVPPKAHAASGHADQPPGRSHPGPSPLDIPARPAAPKAAPPRPAPPAHPDGTPQPAAAATTATTPPAPPEATVGAPQTDTTPATLPASKAKVKVTGAQALVMALERVGVEVVFGIPGGAVLPAYDPLLDSKQIRHILVRHEQGAGHAATGYAQATGRTGVCMATSGPGATNLVTPLADAYMDSVPVVAITGQVSTNLIGTDGFQEADISGITLPI